MPLKMVRARTLPIGVDLGTTAVRMAQMRTIDEAVELLAAGAAPLKRSTSPPERLESLGGAIRDVLKFNAFKSRQAILSLPAELAFVQHVKLPKLSAQETASALTWELQGKLPFAAEDAIIRHMVAGDVFGEGEARQEVIAVAADRAVIEQFVKMAGKAGLEVVGVNIDACAIAECFGRLFRRTDDAARTILFLDLGAASTQVVLTHGDRIVFARNLAMGGDALDQALAGGLKIPVEQARALRRDSKKGQQDRAAEDELYHLLDKPVGALADELLQCLRYYESVFRNQSVERAIFVGGQAYDKRLCQQLAQRLNLTAQIGDPLVRIRRAEGAGLDIGLDRREPQPDWAVAVGLSLGAAGKAA